MIDILNYIDGETLPSESHNWLSDYNPAEGKVYAQLPDSDEKDVENAYKAAAKAYPIWSSYSVEKRSEILSNISKGISENLEKLALAESIDNGKPISVARTVDIPRAASNFEFFAKAITQFSSETYENQSSQSINVVLRQSLGVVGCISPWNLPLYLFTWKIAPALAAGNTVVAKPSEVTPMTAYLLSDICKQAGLPNGVLNIVHGLGSKVGQAIVEHPYIKAISFTGGTATGATIARTAAPMFKKLSLELGGKNPNIIFADCEYEKMLNTTMRSSFANQGQICLCGSRILVESSIYEKLKKDLIEKTQNLIIGNPLSDKTQIGAVVSEEHQNKILGFIETAKKEGNTILCGGEKVVINGFENGYFISPCIIETTDSNCTVNQQEIFGPVVSLQKFETEEEALTIANGVRYGLSSTLWTQDINRAMRMSKNIQAGIVWVNTWMNRDLRTPFGGVKDSGVGREGGFEALKFFTEPKNICIEYSQ